jgi:hypothetical protein
VELLRPVSDAIYGAKSVAFTGTAGSTGTWPAGPQGVLIWSTTDCYVQVGAGVTATTADTPVPSYTPITFFVPYNTGEPWRVSAIQISAGGTVYAKPINKE